MRLRVLRDQWRAPNVPLLDVAELNRRRKLLKVLGAKTRIGSIATEYSNSPGFRPIELAGLDETGKRLVGSQRACNYTILKSK